MQYFDYTLLLVLYMVIDKLLVLALKKKESECVFCTLIKEVAQYVKMINAECERFKYNCYPSIRSCYKNHHLSLELDVSTLCHIIMTIEATILPHSTLMTILTCLCLSIG